MPTWFTYTLKHGKSMKSIVITNVKRNDVAKRRKNYLILMSFRVLLVPGVIFLPINPIIKSAIILLAAITQMIAVISANTPNSKPENNQSLITTRPSKEIAEKL